MVVAVEDSKEYLRRYAISLRKNIKNKKILETKIKNNILNNKKVIKSDNILIYVSLKYEVDTLEIISELWKLNKKVFVPKVIGKEIIFYQINSLNDLSVGYLNILEPNTNIKYKNENNTCAIIPGLLFDKNNNRLGYGGGYFDRFLKDKNIYKIGICFSTMLVDKIKINDFDIKMDEVITERSYGI